MNRLFRKYFLGITFLIIFLLLAVQVRWIVFSIRFQEKVFEKSVSLALNETISNLTSDLPLCSMMRECVSCDSVRLDVQLSSTGIWEKIHDAIDEELQSYAIDLDYEMLILENKSEELKALSEELKEGEYFTRCLGKLLGQAGYQLVIKFPSRTTYFLEKAGLMFIASVLLIFLLIISLFYLLRLYKNEIRIAKHTKELLNNVSHEFKTPLASIALASNMIKKKRYADESKLESYSELISKENKKLQRLVESLLRLEAVERNAFDYSKETIDIHSIIRESISTFEVIIDEKKGEIKTVLEADNPMVFADKLHCINVFVNLISNAIKYTKQAPVIKIQTKSIYDKVQIEVADNGFGIAEKYQKYIFDKYYRIPTGDVHNVKGFGIGLAYVKMVIEAHNGDISLVSHEEQGTTFTLVLPNAKTEKQ